MVILVLGNEASAERVDHPVGIGTSASSRRRMIFGYTADGRYIAVVYEQVDEETVYPVTAFEVPEPA